MTGIDFLRAGIHADIPAEDYHNGPTRTPALSAGIAKLLITHSPLHAWTAHPQLNPRHERSDKDAFDLGSAVHVLLLEGEKFADQVEAIDAPDWRTKAAKEAKATARDEGLIPLLAKDWVRTVEMVEAVRAQIAELDIHPPLFADGKPEQTLIWEEENGVTCRARLDWLRDDLTAIDDYKSTQATANPHVWSRRTFWSIGCDVQAAFYCRGVQALTGKWPEFRFLACECQPPYAISVLSPAASAFELGQRKVELAIRKWQQCLETDRWPAYPQQVGLVELDGWQDADFLKLAYEEEAVGA